MAENPTPNPAPAPQPAPGTKAAPVPAPAATKATAAPAPAGKAPQDAGSEPKDSGGGGTQSRDTAAGPGPASAADVLPEKGPPEGDSVAREIGEEPEEQQRAAARNVPVASITPAAPRAPAGPLEVQNPNPGLQQHGQGHQGNSLHLQANDDDEDDGRY